MASRGDNLILTARRIDRLQSLADELNKAYGTESVVIEVDVANPDGAPTLFSETEKRGVVVDLLINNTGFGKHSWFWDQSVATYSDIVQLNITTLVTLCHLCLVGMLIRKRGGIINIASIAGFPSAPIFSVYAAAKAFVVSFSQMLAIEARAEGVTVSTLCPGSTANVFQAVADDKAELSTAQVQATMQSTEDVAPAGLEGYKAGKLIVASGIFNKIYIAAPGVLPKSIVRNAVARMAIRQQQQTVH